MRISDLDVYPTRRSSRGGEEDDDVEEGVDQVSSMPELGTPARWSGSGNVDDHSLLKRTHLSPASCLPDATMAVDSDEDTDDDEDHNGHDGRFGIYDDDDDRGANDGSFPTTTSTAGTIVVRSGASPDDGFSFAPPAAIDDGPRTEDGSSRANRLSPIARRCDRKFFASFAREVRTDKARRERCGILALLMLLIVTVIALSIALSTASGRLSTVGSPAATMTPNTGDVLLDGGDGAAEDEEVYDDVALSNRPDLSSWIGTNATAIEDEEELAGEAEGDQNVNSTTVETVEDLENVLEQIGSWTNSTDIVIVEALSTKPDFSTLSFAIESAGLHDVLSGDGPFTLFAPTNNAFATLSAETMEYLLRPENVDRLRNALLYHVINGSYASSDLPSGVVQTLRTTSLGGEDEDDILVIDAMSTTGIVTLDGRANVIISDAFQASNGVVHAIDHVLLPDDVAALATSDYPAEGEGGVDFIDAIFPEDDSSSTNATDDFFNALLSLDDWVALDDDQTDVDDVGGTSDETDLLAGDDFFDGFLELDSFVADNFTDDVFPTRDDWYEENDMLTGTADAWGDKPVNSSDHGGCFSDISCCFFFICR